MKVPGWISTPWTTAVQVADRPVGSDDEAVAGADGPCADPAGDGVAGGVEGNSRLTAASGLILLILLAVEGVTLLGVRGMLTLHVAVGAILVGPVLLKSATTGYRFARYYTGAETYRRKGPPPTPLRVIGPLVILSTLALLGTGIALIITGPSSAGLLLTAHQASFWIWIGLMSVHVLGHVWEAAVLTWRDLRSSWRGPGARRRRWRLVAVVAALMVGVGAATVLVPSAAPWSERTARPVAHAPRTVPGQP